MRIALIVAMDQQGGIGLNNDLPWKLPADLRYFKQITMGKPLLMGRNTHESIGRALPGRQNIVLTAQQHYQANGCDVVHNIDDALAVCAAAEEVMVMGGALLYHQLLPKAQRLYLTRVQAIVESDTFFPAIDWSHWRLVDQQAHLADASNAYNYTFEIYDRV